MVRLRLEYAAGLSGTLFVGLTVTACSFAGPQPPALNTSAVAIKLFYTVHRTPIGLSTYLLGLGLLCFLCFAGCLASMVAEAEAEDKTFLPAIASFSGSVTVAGGFAATLLLATLAFRASSMDPPIAKLTFDLWNMALYMALFPVAVLIASSSIAALRSETLPRVSTWVGLPVSAACLVTATAGHHTTGPFVYGGDYRFPLFLLVMLWVLATSVHLAICPAGNRARKVRPHVGISSDSDTAPESNREDDPRALMETAT